MRPSRSAVAGALLATSSTLAAQLFGPEFRVNTGTAGEQRAPDVAMDGDGRMLVVWNDQFSSDDLRARLFLGDGSPASGDELVLALDPTHQNVSVAALGAGQFVVVWKDSSPSYGQPILGQRVGGNPLTPAGPLFRVATDFPSPPDVAADGQGNFMVVWKNPAEDRIYARRYGSAGSPLTDAFRVSGPTNAVSYPAVAADSGGGFVVVWAAAYSGDRVVGQRFSPDGSPRGLAFRVNNHTNSTSPRVAANSSGDFVVIWKAGLSTFGQRYSSSGAPQAGEFRVNGATATDYSWPDIDRNGSGFVIVSLAAVDGYQQRITAQFFESGGRPVGKRSVLNEFTSGSQNGARVAASANGRFVAVWDSPGQDGDGSGIFARRLALPPAPAADAFRVNTTTTFTQYAARVAQNGDGTFLVVWGSDSLPGGSGKDVAAQLFSTAGAPVGGEIRVNVTTAGTQTFPAASGLPSGEFAVAWAGDTDGDSRGIFVRRVSSAGALLGGETRVNTYTSGSQNSPLLAVDGSGGYVVAWTSPHGGNGLEIYAQLFSSAGAPVGAERHVNTTTAGGQYLTGISAGGPGFVVTWQATDGIGWGAFAQRFDGAGSPLGGEFRANVETNGDQHAPTVSVAASGDFVIAWNSVLKDGAGHGIVARRFSSAGAPLTGEFVVNSYTSGDEYRPELSRNPASGDILVAWYGPRDGSGRGISAQLLSASGAAKGGEFLVNTYTTSTQDFPRVSLGKSAVVVWHSAGQDGSANGIYASMYTVCRSSDANGDGQINVSDVLYLINHLFAGGSAPACGGDADGNGQVNVSDVLYLINHLFAGGPPPV